MSVRERPCPLLTWRGVPLSYSHVDDWSSHYVVLKAKPSSSDGRILDNRLSLPVADNVFLEGSNGQWQSPSSIDHWCRVNRSYGRCLLVYD